MKRKTNRTGNASVLCRLGIERCRTNLSHLLAIMHLCEPESLGLDPWLAETARQIVAAIDRELCASTQILDQLESA